MTKHLRILAPLLAAAALAAGCGGSSSDSNQAAAGGDDYGYSAPAKKAEATPTTEAAAAPKAGGATVELTNTTFSPQTIDVKVGDTVTFVNKDEIAHTATAHDGSFDSKTLDNGGTFKFTATKAGAIAYVCAFHPSMTGTINVSA